MIGVLNHGSSFIILKVETNEHPLGFILFFPTFSILGFLRLFSYLNLCNTFIQTAFMPNVRASYRIKQVSPHSLHYFTFSSIRTSLEWCWGRALVSSSGTLSSLQCIFMFSCFSWFKSMDYWACIKTEKASVFGHMMKRQLYYLNHVGWSRGSDLWGPESNTTRRQMAVSPLGSRRLNPPFLREDHFHGTFVIFP